MVGLPARRAIGETRPRIRKPSHRQLRGASPAVSGRSIFGNSSLNERTVLVPPSKVTSILESPL